ncbi:5'-methylthioadenosine nucleosidase [Labilithrix luteola]|uniref:5'-methylthioadenosine nucleosidase n=1 Tax=Labilithrix luteola TaxID=1391654 RepID=A0A0K1PYH8_9BACT|nr:hypothetical protein [Labilithrix luteola]AKU98199.1 5'-methylthioadenosine nucleosidase [Labilithrix luteola]
MKLLVVAAFEPELTEFRSLARDANVANLEVAAIGVGLVEAAIGMTRAIHQHRPTHALLLGTCGAFAGGVAINDVVTGARAILLDGPSVESRAALPPPLPQECGLALAPPIVAAGATSVEIANTLGITTDDALATNLSAAASKHPNPNGAVEHLEAFAFARACAAAGVVAGVVLGVANVVGSRGREQWRANHVGASAKAAQVAIRAVVGMNAA